MKQKLTDCKSIQEAINILKDRKASNIYNSYAKTAFLVKDSSGTILPKMLQEMENNLQHDEDEKAKHEMNEMHEMITTGEDVMGDNRKTGESAQSDSLDVSGQKDKAVDKGDTSKPAQAQEGTSQLESPLAEGLDAVTPKADDPMNTCVIGKMNNGMSEVEAKNACAKENSVMEGIVRRELRKIMTPVLNKTDTKIKHLSEALTMYDKKFEDSRKPKKDGLSEGIDLHVAASPQKQKDGKFDELNTPQGIESYRKAFNERYIQ